MPPWLRIRQLDFCSALLVLAHHFPAGLGSLPQDRRIRRGVGIVFRRPHSQRLQHYVHPPVICHPGQRHRRLPFASRLGRGVLVLRFQLCHFILPQLVLFPHRRHVYRARRDSLAHQVVLHSRRAPLRQALVMTPRASNVRVRFQQQARVRIVPQVRLERRRQRIQRILLALQQASIRMLLGRIIRREVQAHQRHFRELFHHLGGLD